MCSIFSVILLIHFDHFMALCGSFSIFFYLLLVFLCLILVSLYFFVAVMVVFVSFWLFCISLCVQFGSRLYVLFSI